MIRSTPAPPITNIIVELELPPELEVSDVDVWVDAVVVRLVVVVTGDVVVAGGVVVTVALPPINA